MSFGTGDSNSGKPSNISGEFSSYEKLQLKHEWPLSMLKLSIFTLVDSNKEALDMFTFSRNCSTVVKYVTPDGTASLISCSKGSVENVPSKT